MILSSSIYNSNLPIIPIIRDYFYPPLNFFQEKPFVGDLTTGLIVACLVALVIFGGTNLWGNLVGSVASFVHPTCNYVFAYFRVGIA